MMENSIQLKFKRSLLKFEIDVEIENI